MINTNSSNKTKPSVRRFESLFSSIERKSSLPQDEQLSPTKNVASIEYTVEQARNQIESIALKLCEKEERILNGSSETFSFDETNSFRNVCTWLRSLELESLKAKKMATETTAIQASKFDAVTVLSMVKQIPALVTRDLDSFLAMVFNTAKDTLLLCITTALGYTPSTKSLSDDEKNVIANNILREIAKEIPLLGKMSQFEVAKVSSEFANRLSGHIDELQVVSGQRDSSGAIDLNDKKSINDVQEMLGSIIVEKTKGDDDSLDSPPSGPPMGLSSTQTG